MNFGLIPDVIGHIESLTFDSTHVCVQIVHRGSDLGISDWKSDHGCGAIYSFRKLHCFARMLSGNLALNSSLSNSIAAINDVGS
jgi:hypothetical protein